MHGASGCPSWASLTPDVLHLVYSCGPLRGDMSAWAVGEATCRAWRAGLKTFKPEALVIGEGMGSSLRQAALLVHWLATHPLTQLRHLWLPTNSATHAALEVAIRALPRGELRSLRMTEHQDQFRWMEEHLSVFTGLTSLHLTLRSNLRPSDSLHTQLCKLSATLQDLYLASPLGSRMPNPPVYRPPKRPRLNLRVHLPHLTRLGLGRPFQSVALDFGHMPQLQRLELRTFSSIDGAATLSQCTQLSELEVFGSAAKKVLPAAAAAASLRHLMLHYAPGAEKHCPAALVALTALRCMALKGKHSSKLLPMEPMPSLQALFLDDKDIRELFYGPAKLYSQLRVLHLAGAKAEDLMDCVIYPGLVQIQKQRDDWTAGGMRGLAVRYAWFEAMLRPGLPGGEQCLICPLESGGAPPTVTPQHLQSQLHWQQLERFRQYEKDYKEEVAPSLALWHTMSQEMQRLTAGLPVVLPSLASVRERLDSHCQNVMAALAAVERARSWRLVPPLQAASVLMGQITGAAQLLGLMWPALSLKTLTDIADAQWAAALTEAEALVKSLSVLAQQ